ncbi:putative ribosomal protein S4 [Cryptosporidium canis]|uniref:Ribosomal protein S4 n=1 Tax=Cryptosporidium canis TaxID=195482 RepID=A0A9D5DQC4_9CRYT|nr:putative ribosomal protein S4 [Cryptosporidium canis]
MTRGPKKHMKRVAAPSNWMLDKLTGVYAPRPSSGPHKLRECIPLAILLRNRLKFALTYTEAKYIVMQRLIKVDGKVRTDICFPLGLMDIVSIDRVGKNIRIMYDTKGRFVPVQIDAKEAGFKLCKVNKVTLGAKGIPTATTNDARTLRYIHPDVKANDTVKIDLATGKYVCYVGFSVMNNDLNGNLSYNIEYGEECRLFLYLGRPGEAFLTLGSRTDILSVLDFVKCEVGNMCMVTGGRSQGRVGTITHFERKMGSQCIVTVRDQKGATFATLMKNIFVIGEDKPLITLPKDKGIRLSNVEDRNLRMKKHKN